jgi:hypothetical protein
MRYARLAFVLTAATVAAASQATILTFDMANVTGDGALMPQDYGDFVTATTMGNYSYGMGTGFTPDVNVDYGPHDLNLWNDGYNDLHKVVENENDGENGYDIIFTPNPIITMTIQSFDFGNWGGAVTLPGISIRDQQGILWQQTNINVPASSATGHLTFTPNISSNQRLYLHVDTTGLGGNSDNMGMDNIAFSQTSVPEPATMSALAIGALALLRKRRRA